MFILLLLRLRLLECRKDTSIFYFHLNLCYELLRKGWQVFIPSKSVVTIFLEREYAIGIKFLSPSTLP
jgi:hypothetical protein